MCNSDKQFINTPAARLPRLGLGMSLALLLPALAAFAQAPVTVSGLVEKQQVYQGEPFIFQIKIDGHDNPPRPQLPAMPGFSVQEAGDQQNNSESVTIINGPMNRVVKRGYFFNYRLIAQKTGRLSIPAVSLEIDGKPYRTQPIPIQVKAPKESDDYVLRQEISNANCYIGEPLTLTTTWYLKRNVRNYAIAIPLLEDKRFLADPVEPQQQRNKEYAPLTIGATQVIAEKGQGKFKQQNYTTFTFKHILIPTEAGAFELPPASLSCEGQVGNRQPQSLFDDFFERGRGLYENFVASANPIRLTVKPLPTEGRPAHFSGLIGRYTITASATPTNVHVGDPITLTLRVTGSEYLKHFDLPPLQEQPELAKGFKIPSEIADGKLQGDTKIFTQTIRAQHADLTEIPPITLSYFDSTTGGYKEAKSKPIPLTVEETKVVTAADVEGVEPVRTRNRITAWQEGIAYNYEDSSALESQVFGPAHWMRAPLWLMLLFLPPALYLALLAVRWKKHLGAANPELRRAKKAGGVFRSAAGRLREDTAAADFYPRLLEAVRDYLGAKLNLSAGALTCADAEKALAERGVTGEAVSALNALFTRCEAHQYAAGESSPEESAAALDAATDCIAQLEKELKG